MTGFIYKKLTLTMLLLAFMQGAASEVSRLVLDGVVYESNGGKWEVSGIDTSDSNFPSNGVITIRTTRRINVRVFTILGQNVSSATLNPGTSELRIGSRGIFIVKIGNLTQKVAL